jgi:hypothetical protein
VGWSNSEWSASYRYPQRRHPTPPLHFTLPLQGRVK